MHLEKFRVTCFRSVVDSGWIEADDITALIGTNESGKTNVLLPLWKLNPADHGDIILLDDAPRDKFHSIDQEKDKPIFVTAIFQLNRKERSDIAALCKNNVDDAPKSVSVARDYNKNYFIEFIDSVCLVKHTFKDIAEIIGQYKEAISSVVLQSGAESLRQEKAVKILEEIVASDEFADIIKISKLLDKCELSPASSKTVQQMAELKEILTQWKTDNDMPRADERPEVVAYIQSNMPKFVYYSNYGNLDSQIYLPRVMADMARNDLGERESARVRTVKTLFTFVNLKAQEIVDLGQNTINGHAPSNDTEVGQVAENKRKRTVLLNSASDDFTKKFSEWWKQGNHAFKFQADGDFFRIWVSDSVRPENIELEARSTGLQWFFSFYLVFLVEAQSKHQNAILLLDEPGLTLHPVAQRDLFVFFENLATNNQILYTTHSPFMIDSNHLERVRAVYVEDTGKTVVSPDLRAIERKSNKNQTQSVFAVHAALGLTVSDTLLINCNSILVEGESDQHLLSALKITYIASGIIKPTKEMVFIPTGGTKGIKTTANRW